MHYCTISAASNSNVNNNQNKNQKIPLKRKNNNNMDCSKNKQYRGNYYELLSNEDELDEELLAKFEAHVKQTQSANKNNAPKRVKKSIENNITENKNIKKSYNTK